MSLLALLALLVFHVLFTSLAFNILLILLLSLVLHVLCVINVSVVLLDKLKILTMLMTD